MAKKKVQDAEARVTGRHKGDPLRRETSMPNADRLPLLARVRVALSVSDHKTARAVARRRGVAIMGYVGPNGGSKTATLVMDSLPSLDRGRRVLSTVPLYLEGTKVLHPMYERFWHLDQLLEAENCDILMDEVAAVAGSHDSLKLDPRIKAMLKQLRKRNCVLRWSSPSWDNAAKDIRQVTQAVTECRGYYPGKFIQTAEGALNLWAPRRLFLARTFDTIEFDAWTAGKRERIEPMVKHWWKGPGSRAFASYDTYEAVERLSGINEDSGCDSCGGYRPRPKCSCPAPPARHGEGPQSILLGGVARGSRLPSVMVASKSETPA